MSSTPGFFFIILYVSLSSGFKTSKLESVSVPIHDYLSQPLYEIILLWNVFQPEMCSQFNVKVWQFSKLKLPFVLG